VLLYHRTSVSQARAIVRGGFKDEKWALGSDLVTGETMKAVGVWLSDRPLPAGEGPGGAAVLEVTLPLPDTALTPFGVLGILTDAQLWIIPAKIVNQHAGIRVSEVDARSSWFHELMEEGEE
jgi:hypothetical protein